MIGQTIAHYKLTAKLGAGGMGEVYRATDTKLGRDVALKILPADTLADESARERLLREARSAAALNHPHICTIHEVGEAGGQAYIAMELVEGQSLSTRLAGGPLPLNQVLRYGLQLSEALAHAHDRSIVHRDLKCANVVINSEGRVKVLDFGLAKRVSENAMAEVTRSQASLTRPGEVVGTLAYMAPEQLRAQPADARSDIWALGVMLYEMASGARPFQGRTGFELSSSILNQPPSLPEKVPIELRAVIDRCLEKEPARRYQRAGEVRAALEAMQTGAAAPWVGLRYFLWRRRWLALIAASLAVVGLLAAAYVFVRTRPFGRIPSEQWAAITNFPDSATSPALSADGRMLAFLRGPSTFVGRGQVYVKLLPRGEPKQLTNDSYEKMSPVFSTDTSQVAYTVVDQTGNWDTWIVSSLGGESRRFLPNASGLTWVDSGRVLFSEIKKGNHMAVVTATESRAGPRDVYVPARETGMGHRSYASPDRKWVLVVEMEQSRWLPCRLAPFDGTSMGRPVGPSGPCTSAAWSPDGKWMYFSSDAGSGFHIWRERFPDGSPEQITLGPTEEEGIAMAPDGGWFFTSAGVKQSAIWLHDARGDRQISLEGFADLPGLGVGATHSVFSPDEKRLYFVVGRNSAGPFVAGELAAADLDSGRTERLLPGILITSFDISADNKRVVFAKPDAGGKLRIWLASLDRRFPPRQLTNAEGDQPFFGHTSQIIFRGAEGAAHFVFRIREDGSEMEKMVFDVTNDLEAVSPDGSWVVASVAVPGASEEDRPAGFLAYPVSGGPPTRICAFCDVGWSGDGRFFYLRLRAAGMGEGGTAFVIALPPGKTLPPLPQGGIQSEADLARLRVVQRIELTDVPHISFAPSSSVYAFSRATVQRNLYRIPVL